MTQSAALLRQETSAKSVRLIDAASMLAQAAAWDDLVVRALAPHPHFSRHVIEAHLKAGLARGDLRFVTVWSGQRLDAALPFHLALDITGFGGFVAKPFLTPFMSSSAPLVANEDVETTLALLVAGLATTSSGRVWRWPLLSTNAPVGAALLDAMARAGWGVAQVEAFERPVLDRRATLEAFHKDHPNKNRLKDLRRRQRRLAEAGTLTFEIATEGEALEKALDSFLDLEAQGWKGAGGTALKSRPQTLALARALFAAGPGPVSVRADTLNLDGRPLAISLALIAGGTVSLLKTAYDERERAHAPGLVLESEIVRSLHETAFAVRLDSATLAGSVLESLYRERETVAEIIAVPPGGEGLLSLERRVRLARFEHRARNEAKRVLRRR